jgi:hypothetical protein
MLIKSWFFHDFALGCPSENPFNAAFDARLAYENRAFAPAEPLTMPKGVIA